ncbi:ABC transporter ATP-binding protein [Paenibacillus bouchesdurhonensis]|uniref:ABC transporter ATP-binding protein n=1 Tax=Paenibacillus bouchesdurhonensis TaxID=1870990 RepID=UPI000DA601B5|nr:ABC transporter ATP-binding protein [Paenibacillus bouchesdurhonensis]
MDNNLLLSVNNLCKTYTAAESRISALKDITFDLKKSELLIVMGTSGSGKSTLLQIIGALDSPDQGTISLNGVLQDKMFMEPYATQYRSENIGFIFQSFHLLKDLSVEENIALPLILKGASGSEIKRKVNEMLDLVGLTSWRKQRPMQLSGGQQQRVAIGRSLIMRPPIILADEPTGNLDFNTSREILNVLIEMNKQLNQSIILVTHDANVAAYGDRILFFHDGEIVDTYVKNTEEADMDCIMDKLRSIMETAS